MNKKKFQVQALALAVMMAASTLAAAANPGTVALTNTTDNIWSADIGNTPLLGSFTDVFTFTPDATAGSWAWTQISNLAFSPNSAIGFTSVDLNGTSLASWSVPVFGGSFNIAGTLLPLPVSGTLVLTVKGVSTGGSYGGNFAVAMAPVPEPATYGMMIGGLGILAMLARRRKQ